MAIYTQSHPTTFQVNYYYWKKISFQLTCYGTCQPEKNRTRFEHCPTITASDLHKNWKWRFPRWNETLTSYHARRTFPKMSPKIAILPQFQVYLSITWAKQIISLFASRRFLSGDVTPTRSKRKRRIVVYGIWSLVMVRNQLAAQVVKRKLVDVTWSRSRTKSWKRIYRVSSPLSEIRKDSNKSDVNAPLVCRPTLMFER